MEELPIKPIMPVQKGVTQQGAAVHAGCALGKCKMQVTTLSEADRFTAQELIKPVKHVHTRGRMRAGGRLLPK